MSNALTYKGNGIIQIMSTAELNALSQYVLEYMATVDGPGSIYTANGTGNVLIGTFSDTNYSGNIGEGNVTVITNTYDLYQDMSTPSGTTPPTPIRFTSNTAPLQVMTGTQLNSLADTILQYCVTQSGPFSYYLANTAPSDGGTWTSVGQLNNVYTPGTTNITFLWKKLSSGSYTLYRPLKFVSNGTIQLFSNTELQSLSKVVRERIVNTEIGTYRLQASTPVTGTWSNVGVVVDTRPTISDTLYDGSTTTEFTTGGQYDGSTTAIYVRNTYRTETFFGPSFGSPTQSFGTAPATFSSPGAPGPPVPAFFAGFVPTGVYGVEWQAGSTWIMFPSFTGGYFANFAGTVPGPPGPPSYFSGFAPVTFNGMAYFSTSHNEYFTGTLYYTNVVGAVYTSDVYQYTGPGASYYTDAGSSTYTSVADNIAYTIGNLNYTSVVGAEYAGSVINNDTTNIASLTLWRRIA